MIKSKCTYVCLVFLFALAIISGCSEVNSKKKASQILSTGMPSFNSRVLWINLHNGVKDRHSFCKAIAHVIDKDRIVKLVYNEEVISADHGIFNPSNLPANYDARSINGLKNSQDSAMFYFNLSGYNFKKSIILYCTSGYESSMTDDAEIQKQVKESLGVNIEIYVDSKASIIHRLANNEEGFYLLDLSLDCPHPSSYLKFFYANSSINETDGVCLNLALYDKLSFDYWYDKGLKDEDNKAMEYFLNAEKVLISSARVIPLIYREENMIHKAEVKNASKYYELYPGWQQVYFEK